MSRVTTLKNLYQKAVVEYTENPEEWKGLLTAVARYYKRSFDNAVLIYAQKPNATQLATFDEWHDERIGRSINRRAKSIAVIDMRNPGASLKYLFDFMDTNGTEQTFKNFMRYHWELEEQYRPRLMLRLNEKYHLPMRSIEACIYKLVSRQVTQILPKYMENFKVLEEDSPLYGMPIEAVKAEFQELVVESVAYTVFSKCGISTELFEENSFEKISQYNTLGMFMALGSCTVSLARPILKEIQQEIEAIKNERSQIYENRTFDELRLQAGRGRDDVSRTANFKESGDRQDASGQVREAVESIHDGEPSAPIVGTGGTGQNQRGDFEHGRGGGESQGGLDSTAFDVPANARYRGYTDAGGTYEQSDETGGGNYFERTGTKHQVTSQESQNIEHIKSPADGQKPPVGDFFIVPPRQGEQVQEVMGEPAPAPMLESKSEPESEPEPKPEPKPESKDRQLMVDPEHFELVDEFLSTEGWVPIWADWEEFLYQIYDGELSQQERHNQLKQFYDNLNTDFVIAGEEIHVAGYEDGMVFTIDDWPFYISNDDLLKRIEATYFDTNRLTSRQKELDDFAIPDEVEQMFGAEQKVESEASQGHIESARINLFEIYGIDKDDIDTQIEAGNIEAGGIEPAKKDLPTQAASEIPDDFRYIAAVLRDQSNSLYLQQTIQDYFREETDLALLTDYVRKCYRWGYRDIEHGDIRIHATTYDDGMHIKIYDGAELSELHLTWEQVTINIGRLIEENRYMNTDTPMPPSEEDVIDDILRGKYANNRTKLQIYQVMTNSFALKDHIAVLKHEYGLGGYGSLLENGGHCDYDYDGSGLKIDYFHDGVLVDVKLTWNEVAKRVAELIRQDTYLTSDEKSELEMRGEVHHFQLEQSDDEITDVQPPNHQLSMFDMVITSDTYEETGGEDNDDLLDGNTDLLEPFPFQEGDRISYNAKVYEVLKFLDDGNTAEIGDVSQLQNLNGFKVRERVPVAELRNCKLLKDSYTEGEIAAMEVDAAQNGDNSEEIKEELKAALEVNQENDDYVRTIQQDFDNHTRGNVHNYHFSEEHHLYDGGAKTKCRNNISAIHLLKELQMQGRSANEEEQITLAKFVGWGGLANALTPEKSGWEREYEEIKSLLTEEEFLSAQQSTTTAYYTEQMIIEQMYAALEKFGFKDGNVLDPAMGTGNFYSVLPESMQNSNLYGVELDTISGGIAKQLYPSADIQVKGFEHCDFPDQFFDVVIGNVPFNSIRINDRRYDKHRFKIHEYFLAKSLDQVRPGGIVAVITSKYIMDKTNQATRKYIAQRAELMGAIRLPNNAFKAVAGTEVTSDMLFFKKREREIVPDGENSPWLSSESNEDGIPMNRYFIDHPEMVLGKMVFDESMFGNEKTTACHPEPGDDLKERLERAVYYLEGSYEEASSEYAEERTVLDDSLPADPKVRNFSYTVVDDVIYFQEHSRMYQQDITGKKAERIKGMVELTGIVRDLIAFQADSGYLERELTDEEHEVQLQIRLETLNQVYDRFVEKNGAINSRANVMAFARDSSAPLLRSIEKEDKQKKGVFEKTALFYKATVKPKVTPKIVFSAEDALKVSLNQKGRIDLTYMEMLYRKPNNQNTTKDEIIQELGERIYQDPAEYLGNPHKGWKLAEEYLSGYVKDKLVEAMLMAEDEPERFSRNVEALKAVQPIPLTPDEISYSLGSTWIPSEIYEEFMYDTFKTMGYNRGESYGINLEFSKYSGAYHISGKSREKGSVTASQTYGTERMNAYEILETTLNLKSVEVRDRVEYEDPVTGEDKVKYVLNRSETILAREKQAQIKVQFENWLFAEPERGVKLTKLYNDRFNNIRPRIYHGDDLEFPDMNEEVTLREHQRDVVAMGIYSDGNMLMAHEVGAGKTFSSIALAYELKRLGKVNKPLFTVPNHLVGQWADEYMRLYPQANILVAEKKDFEKRNRRRFASRIAIGEYDAVIMAHSSFELIGLSRERQLSAMQMDINAITSAIEEEKYQSGKGWSLKQMQIFRSNMQSRYDKLFNAEKKDDVINFEELGVDCLIVDEAHQYKNNFSYTKMQNVAGVSSQSSQRAMDMHQKAQYINEIGNGKGVIYLTGTPVANSMSELYVMQKTLQPKALEERGLLMFDSWASTFGKVETSLEIKPEGNGYQMKNRFSRFHNLPELMSMFRMVADIKTADMLDLPVPKLKTGSVQVIKTKITPEQKRMVMELGERAEDIRSGTVDSSMDNFLKLTNEARLLAVDPRAVESDLPDDPDTKLNVCAVNVAEIYHETADKSLTQLIFCDQGTPKTDGSFNFYDATRLTLISKGVKSEEIAFIHDAKSDVQREELFEKVRTGKIRVLIGSTAKMGTGMNVQKKLVALHHLDVPWRPADLTQRNGRALRQGNENEEISIFNYVTENTFDAYLWVRHEVA